MIATARAGSNIAFTKYWGNRDNRWRIPRNSSISMTLRECHTTTTVELDAELADDELFIGDAPASAAATERLRAFMEIVRKLARRKERARARARNTFPMDAGIASSASGFAALALAAGAAYGLELPPRALSRLARRGSGSACRSAYGGFVEWRAGNSDATSFSSQLFPENHWPVLRNLIVVVSDAPKPVGSAAGHKYAPTSPLYSSRLRNMDAANRQTRQAIAKRDLVALGEVLEAEALSLHAVIMTATPSVIYWTPETMRVMELVRRARRDGLQAFFTMDAGPNVHVITTAATARELTPILRAAGFERLILDSAGPAPILLDKHLPRL